jgi:hypothetical protein
METQSGAEDAKTYMLENRDEVRTIVGRNEAVRMAKRISSQGRGRVWIHRKDEREQMQFVDGSLVSFTYQTNDRRRRR